MKTVVLLFLFLIFPDKTLAGTVDLELALDLGDTHNLEFAHSYPYSITMINHGPDDAAVDLIAPFPLATIVSNIRADENGFLDFYFHLDGNIEQNCRIISGSGTPLPGGEAEYFYFIMVPVILANTSITCFGTYTIGFESGSRLLNFGFYPGFDTDTDLSNNVEDVVFRIKPRVIPAINGLGLMFILLFVLISGFWHLRRVKSL
ncbi:MAG TPA: hypothetical protein ENJ41_00785 [Oceanospirillales bacterium]|nr:hypothetical protein [Oceanospirillales bacterium]